MRKAPQPSAKGAIIANCPDSVTFPRNRSGRLPGKVASNTECKAARLCPQSRAMTKGTTERPLVDSAINKIRLEVNIKEARCNRLLRGFNPNMEHRAVLATKRRSGVTKNPCTVRLRRRSENVAVNQRIKVGIRIE